MRKTINTISIMLFGASILIFISALLIPLRKDFISLGENSKTAAYEPSDSLKKTIEKSAPNRTQNPVAVSKLEASITQFESEVKQNESAIDTEDSGPRPSLQTAPETTAPRIHEEPSEPVNLIDAKEERSPRHEPTSLLVLGDGLFPVEQARPRTNLEKAIDKIIPRRRRESTSQGRDSEIAAYEPSDSLKKTIEKSAPNRTQNPVAVSKLEASITQFESEVKQNESAIDTEDSGARPSLQTAPETTAPRIHEGPSEPVNLIDAEEERSPQHEPISLLVLGDGLFPVEQARPTTNLEKAIGKIIPLIQQRPSDKVVVEGHADKWVPRGANPAQISRFNKVISLRRAQVVARALELGGIAHDRIIVKGLGDTVPIASNHTKEGRAKNRRVEIKLSPAR